MKSIRIHIVYVRLVRFSEPVAVILAEYTSIHQKPFYRVV